MTGVYGHGAARVSDATLRFICPTSGLGVTLEPAAVRKLKLAASQAWPNETGGVLVGRYTSARTMAQVEDLSTATEDSKAGKRWFVRGTQRLSHWLQACLKDRRQTYVGEWHTHPGGAPDPSWQDIASVREISTTPAMDRPETILLILGGDLRSNPTFHVSVITEHIHLRLEKQPISAADAPSN